MTDDVFVDIRVSIKDLGGDFFDVRFGFFDGEGEKLEDHHYFPLKWSDVHRMIRVKFLSCVRREEMKRGILLKKDAGDQQLPLFPDVP